MNNGLVDEFYEVNNSIFTIYQISSDTNVLF